MPVGSVAYTFDIIIVIRYGWYEQSSTGLLNILDESLCSAREERRLVPVQFRESSQVAGGRLKSQRWNRVFICSGSWKFLTGCRGRSPVNNGGVRSRTANINRHLISLWGVHLRASGTGLSDLGLRVLATPGISCRSHLTTERCSYPAGCSLYLWRFRRCYRCLETNSCDDALEINRCPVDIVREMLRVDL